jgi:hypothetical protein
LRYGNSAGLGRTTSLQPDADATLGGVTMSTFACVSCQSRSFTLDGEFRESTLARCARCGAALGSWRHLRRELERRLLVEGERGRTVRGEPPPHCRREAAAQS